MTIEEATKRAQVKLGRGHTLDAYDVQSLVSAVAAHYREVGRAEALSEVIQDCLRKGGRA